MKNNKPKPEYFELDWSENKRKVNKSGYIEIHYPEHPNNSDGYVLMHRLIVERHLQRFLRRDEVVHHVDENKQRNVMENLFLTNEKEHAFIHRLGKQHSEKTKNTMSKKHIGKLNGRQRDFNGRLKKSDPV